MRASASAVGMRKKDAYILDRCGEKGGVVKFVCTADSDTACGTALLARRCVIEQRRCGVTTAIGKLLRRLLQELLVGKRSVV